MDASPLTRLSPELRNAIYEHVFITDSGDAGFARLQEGIIQHPLTWTCRQVRNESLLLYYASAHFHIESRKHRDAINVAGWLSTIGLTCALHIREVTLDGASIHGWEATRRVMKHRSDRYLLMPVTHKPREHLDPLDRLLGAFRDAGLEVRRAEFIVYDDERRHRYHWLMSRLVFMEKKLESEEVHGSKCFRSWGAAAS